VPREGSFLARCALKFSEVVAAGVATALSGYVVAHLAAPMFSATQPAARQSPVEGPRPTANAIGAAATLPQAASTDHSTPHGPSKPEAKLVEPAAGAPTRSKISPTKSKPVETRAAAETVVTGAAARRSQDAAGRKPDTAESLEARVRAALARSNGRSALTDVPRRRLQMPSAVPSAVPSVEPRPPAAAVAAAPPEPAPGSVASVPRAAVLPPQRIDIAPQPAEAPAPPIRPNPATQMTVRQQTPGQNPGGQTTVGQTTVGQNPSGQNPGGQNSAIQLPPLTTVVVKSQPSVGVESPQPAPAAADAQAPHEDQGRGPFSSFARMLRSDKPLPEDQAPRPPIAVGQ
jgi:hypothetical protein